MSDLKVGQDDVSFVTVYDASSAALTFVISTITPVEESNDPLFFYPGILRRCGF